MRQVVSQYEQQWLEPNMQILQSQWIEKVKLLTDRMLFRLNRSTLSITTPEQAFQQTENYAPALYTPEYGAQRLVGRRKEETR